MKRASWATVLAAVIIASAGCTHKEQTTTSGSEGSSGAAASPAADEQVTTTAPAPTGKLVVTFQFSDVAVTTSAAPVLRLGFTVKNGSSDPLLCTDAAFTLQLSDGTILPPDAGAENLCDPDSIDPGSSGKATIFFDLKNSYSGPVTLIMRDSNNALIGQGTTQVH